MFNNMNFGKSGMTPFYGVVEDNDDPLRQGRVRVRAFGFHNEDKTELPTLSLPWATVLQPTTSASMSGVGFSPNGLLPRIMGFWILHGWRILSISNGHGITGRKAFTKS